MKIITLHIDVIVPFSIEIKTEGDLTVEEWDRIKGRIKDKYPYYRDIKVKGTEIFHTDKSERLFNETARNLKQNQ